MSQKPKPTIPEEWWHLTNLYEQAMLKDKQTIASLKEKVNTLQQKLKDSHRVSPQEINRIRAQLKDSHLHKNGDREAF